MIKNLIIFIFILLFYENILGLENSLEKQRIIQKSTLFSLETIQKLEQEDNLILAAQAMDKLLKCRYPVDVPRLCYALSLNRRIPHLDRQYRADKLAKQIFRQLRIQSEEDALIIPVSSWINFRIYLTDIIDKIVHDSTCDKKYIYFKLRVEDSNEYYDWLEIIKHKYQYNPNIYIRDNVAREIKYMNGVHVINIIKNTKNEVIQEWPNSITKISAENVSNIQNYQLKGRHKISFVSEKYRYNPIQNNRSDSIEMCHIICKINLPIQELYPYLYQELSKNFLNKISYTIVDFVLFFLPEGISKVSDPWTMVQDFMDFLHSPSCRSFIQDIAPLNNNKSLIVFHNIDDMLDVESHENLNIPYKQTNKILDLHGSDSWEIKCSWIDLFIKKAYKKKLNSVEIITGRGLHNPDGKMGVLWSKCKEYLLSENFRIYIKGIITVNKEGGWKIILNDCRKEKYKELNYIKYCSGQEEYEGF